VFSVQLYYCHELKKKIILQSMFQINELAQATDARRLALLLEVAGAMYWEETRHQDIESLKSMFLNHNLNIVLPVAVF